MSKPFLTSTQLLLRACSLLLNKHAPYKRGWPNQKYHSRNYNLDKKWLSTEKYYKSLFLGSYSLYTHMNYQKYIQILRRASNRAFFLHALAFFVVRKISCSEASAAGQKQPCFTLQVDFKSTEERETFVHWFDVISTCLVLCEGHQLDNHGLTRIFPRDECVEAKSFLSNGGAQRATRIFPRDECVETKSFLSNSGKMDYI